jgi:GT2 family glycosyltransferase
MLENGLAQKIAEASALRSDLGRRTQESEGRQATLALKIAEIRELEAKLAWRSVQHSEVLASTSWRVTAPLRRVGVGMPAAAGHVRRMLKLAWWTATLQLVPRLRGLRARGRNAALLAGSDLFDPAWYLDRYRDVRSVGADPVLHYLDSGAAEGRDPSARFDTEWYLRRNPDVRQADMNPLVHYLQHGKREGRLPAPSASQPEMPRAAPSVVLLPPALEHLLQAFHDADSAPEILDLYAVLARYSDCEISQADLAGMPDLQALVAELSQLARSQPAPAKFAASIIIPVHNKLVHTLCCLKALLTANARSSFEVIVADDVSTDATAAAVAAIGGVVRHRRNAENLGFTRNCNAAAAWAQGDIVVFLNNDTVPLPGWLDELVATLRADASIGLVGSKLVNADGSLQEAGGVVWSDGSAWNFGRNQDATAPQFNYVKEVDYISGASIAAPKLVWDRLAGFDELFAPAYCEDSDFAFRVRAAGMRCVYQPFSAVVHHEGVSHGRDVSTGTKAYQVRNIRRFFERWKATLAAEQLPPGTAVPLARDRSRDRPHILFIDHYVPQPDRDAGSRTICDYLMLFKAAGFHVTLWPQNMHFDRTYAAALQRSGIEVLYDLHQRTLFQDWLELHGPHLDYAFLSRARVALDYVDAIRRESKAKILFYGHDIHFRRLAKEFEVTGQPATRAEMIDCEQIERQMWSKSDVVYYPSGEETDFVRTEHPGGRAQTIPPFLQKGSRLRGARERLSVSGIPRSHQLLFVGGFRHRPNVDGMVWFVREVWPHVQSSVPESRLVIAGSFPPAEIEALAGSTVTVTGFISETALDALYLTTQVAIVPLRFGGGIKGKVVEALSYGTPVVATATGVQGLPDAQRFLDVCDTPEVFAAAVVEVLRDPASHIRKALAGLDFVEGVASEGAARTALLGDVLEFQTVKGGLVPRGQSSAARAAGL